MALRIRGVLRKWGAAAHRGVRLRFTRRSRGGAHGICRHRGRSAGSARQGKTTNAMLRHRGGVLTPYGAPTPLCPSGFAYASLGGLAEVPAESARRRAARLGGTDPSASLGLLDVAHAMCWPRYPRPSRKLGSESRLASGPVASVTRLAPLPQHPSRGVFRKGVSAVGG